MKIILSALCILITTITCADEITPYKFTDDLPAYQIPPSSIFTIVHEDTTIPTLTGYFSKPTVINYPIAIVCGGSSSNNDVYSIIHVHRYFLQEFLDLNVAVLTLEQRGVNGDDVNPIEFMTHYTRSNRLKDHLLLVESLVLNPPTGWNGKLIFFGVSEGGLLVTSLSTHYSNLTLATINWVGAGGDTWKDELWLFLQKLIIENPECPHESKFIECKQCSELITTRDGYNRLMDEILLNPSSDHHFLGMTYKYHADAMRYPTVDYDLMKAPLLVVAGAIDTSIKSSDSFVKQAKQAKVNVTYLRIEDMDHYVRKRPDVINLTFEWLKNQF